MTRKPEARLSTASLLLAPPPPGVATAEADVALRRAHLAGWERNHAECEAEEAAAADAALSAEEGTPEHDAAEARHAKARDATAYAAGQVRKLSKGLAAAEARLSAAQIVAQKAADAERRRELEKLIQEDWDDLRQFSARVADLGALVARILERRNAICERAGTKQGAAKEWSWMLPLRLRNHIAHAMPRALPFGERPPHGPFGGVGSGFADAERRGLSASIFTDAT